MSETIAKAHVRQIGLLQALLLLAALANAGQGPVYRVQQGSGPVGFLVGTMHSEDPRVTALMERFAPLIERVEVVAVEMVPDALSMLAVGAASLLPAGQSLDALLGEDRFNGLAAVARGRGIPLAVLQRLKPWAAAVAIGMPAVEDGRFLDLEIYLKALDAGREVVGLETASEQLDIFEAMSPEAQLALLDDTVKNADLLPTQLEKLTAVYLSGDLDRLAQLARSQYQDVSPAIRSWFEEHLLIRRNRRMAERAAALLAGRPTLVAVGAMHLAGETGLVAALRRRGFDVAPVSP